MGNFSFENQGSMTYLVYRIAEDDIIDTMSLGMLTNNRIPGLIPVVYTQMDSTRYIKYNISSKISVKQFFEGQVNKKRLIGVFSGIAEAILSAEDYMIDVNTIMLDLNYMFADVSTCESVLVCLPLEGQKVNQDIGSFFKSIMFNTRFDQTENCDHVARIINYLNSTPVFSLLEFKTMLDRIKSDNPVTQHNNTAPVQIKKEIPVNNSSTAYVAVKNQPPVKAETPCVVPVSNTVQQVVKQPSVSLEKPASFAPKIQQNDYQSHLNQPSVPLSYETEQQSQVTTPDGKTPSFFWLLMHYSKENKALYDASKNAKKSGKMTRSDASNGFDIPGNQKNTGFAIPGQQSSSAFVQESQTQSKFPIQQSAQQNVQVVSQIKTQSSYQQSYSNNGTVLYGQSVSFGETTVLDGGKMGETTVLSEQSEQVTVKPFLIRAKNNEHIDINKPIFKIGKEKSYVDYFISDNTAISRSHAAIVTHEGQYFILDTNSTNHTYVNGRMIQSNVETPISHGTKIRLANEEFEFKLY